MTNFEPRKKEMLDFAFEMIKENWEAKKKTWLAQRYSIWCAIGLLGTGDKEKIDFSQKMLMECGDFPDKCHFTPNILTQLMVKHEKILYPEVKKKVSEYLSIHFEDILAYDMDFVGVNDNFPCMATYTALVGGEFFGNEKAIEVGRKRLKALHKMLSRRNLLSEYTSRCYTSMSLYHIALIATDVRDEQMKKLALECEEKIWYDIAVHYFPVFNMLAGPYSRAYDGDILANRIREDSLLYYMIFGKGDIEEFRSCGGCDELEMDARICWYFNAEYHFPEKYYVIFNKKYPFEVNLTAEIGPSRFHILSDRLNGDKDHIAESMLEDSLDEYPAGVSVNTTYMEESFALGTALRQFHSSAGSESNFLIYAKNGTPRTVYSRYVINNKILGKVNYDKWMDMEEMPTLLEEGRKLGIQDKSTALVAYKPSYFNHDEINEMRMSVIFALKGDRLDRVNINGEDLAEDKRVFEKAEPVFIEDGEVFMAFIPTEVTNLGRKYSMQFQYINGYAEISYFNYIGETKGFRKNEMLLSSNGYIEIIKSKKDFKSFDDFVNKYKKYELDDKTKSCAHTRGAHDRILSFKNCDTTLEIEFSPLTEGIRYAAAGEKLIV